MRVDSQTTIVVAFALVALAALGGGVTLGLLCFRTAKAMAAENRKAQADGFDKLLAERHHYSQHSIEARLADALEETVNAQGRSIGELTDKVMAYTQEGRDLVEARGRIAVLRDQLTVRNEQHAALMKLMDVKAEADEQRERTAVGASPVGRVHQNGQVTSARFGNSDDMPPV